MGLEVSRSTNAAGVMAHGSTGTLYSLKLQPIKCAMSAATWQAGEQWTTEHSADVPPWIPHCRSSFSCRVQRAELTFLDCDTSEITIILLRLLMLQQLMLLSLP